MDTEQTTFVLHKIRVFQSYFFDADTEVLFDAHNYSMFKYGSGTVARLYGYSLCSRFIDQYKWWFESKSTSCISKYTIHNGEEESTTNTPTSSCSYDAYNCTTTSTDSNIYITCAPYKVAPTASHAVARYFTDALNLYLKANGFPSAIFFSIERLDVYEGDYGQLSESDRKGVMSRNPLRLPHNIDLRNKRLIVLDDIRITGSHEQVVMDLVLSQQPESICKMYVALFEQEKGLEKPQHEATLNNALVKNLTDLDNLIKGMGDNYIPNARVCKFLLAQQDAVALRQFLKRQPPHLLKKLLDYMEGDGYPAMESYRQQFEIVKQAVRINKTQSSQKLVGLGLSMIGGAGIFCGNKS